MALNNQPIIPSIYKDLNKYHACYNFETGWLYKHKFHPRVMLGLDVILTNSYHPNANKILFSHAWPHFVSRWIQWQRNLPKDWEHQKDVFLLALLNHQVLLYTYHFLLLLLASQLIYVKPLLCGSSCLIYHPWHLFQPYMFCKQPCRSSDDMYK
jgi:hypothetical protein